MKNYKCIQNYIKSILVRTKVIQILLLFKI
jgi:hypothetical protein